MHLKRDQRESPLSMVKCIKFCAIHRFHIQMKYETKFVYLLYYFGQLQFSESINIASVTTWKCQNSLRGFGAGGVGGVL